MSAGKLALPDWEAVREWELRAERVSLPRLTVAESVQQYLALDQLGRRLSPGVSSIFDRCREQLWLARHQAFVRIRDRSHREATD